MKKLLLGAGILILPVAYIGVTLANGDPIEWPVLAFMVLLIAPLLLFRNAFNRVPGNVRTAAHEGARLVAAAMQEKPEQPDARPTSRKAGLGMLAVAALVYGIEYVVAHGVGIVQPWILLPAGPLATLGALTVIHPRCFDALLHPDSKRYPVILRNACHVAVIAGLILAMGLIAWLHGN